MAQINFNSIYTAYYRKAFLFTLSYVHNDLVAEDIVSEAIIHLWELSKEREIPSVEAILITYIRSKSLNYLKHLQPEEVKYLPTEIKLKKNFDVEQDFDIVPSKLSGKYLEDILANINRNIF